MRNKQTNVLDDINKQMYKMILIRKQDERIKKYKRVNH